ncbi:MAG: 3-hydroxyacyl-CoA dehydrogenase [Syntrophotaleaceae bacterium]
MQLQDIKKVLVVGGGTMGQQIAFQCAAHNYSVTLYDNSPDALVEIPRRLKEYTDYLVAEGHLDRTQVEAALLRIVPSADAAEAAQDADLLSESVPEDPVLKGKVFKQFNKLCPSRTIFTTNTSMLVPSMMARSTGRPDRFVAFHFHQPAWVGNVADIMPHPGTSAEVVALVSDFARSIGQIPMVLNKESYGYIFNAMYSGLNSAAITLAANGVASVEDIDRSWMGTAKMPIGPLGMLDVVGLDTVWSVTKYWADVLSDPQTMKIPPILKINMLITMVGVKSGRGFYTYPEPGYQSSTLSPANKEGTVLLNKQGQRGGFMVVKDGGFDNL